MMWQDLVDVVHEYDEEVSSPSLTWKLPSVIRLKNLPFIKKRGIKFSRQNVFIRDNFTCQYCERAFVPHDLTYDHIKPKSQGGLTTWENICACCKKCNSKKADRSCKEARMYPANKPVKPKSLPFEPSIFEIEKAPKEWLEYLK